MSTAPPPSSTAARRCCSATSNPVSSNAIGEHHDRHPRRHRPRPRHHPRPARGARGAADRRPPRRRGEAPPQAGRGRQDAGPRPPRAALRQRAGASRTACSPASRRACPATPWSPPSARSTAATSCVIANDYTVKAGTWGKRTFEKITRAQELADSTGTPIVYLFDSAGARIDEQFESFAGRHAWGNIFYNQVQISGRVPQVCALFGPSPAGSAYVPALCDLTIMVRGHATAYLGSPRLAEMVTGERRHPRGDGRGRDALHRLRAVGDVLVEDDEEAIAAIRVWLSFLPPNWEQEPPRRRRRPSPSGARTIEEIVPLRRSRSLRHPGVDRLAGRRRAASSRTRTCSPRRC